MRRILALAHCCTLALVDLVPRMRGEKVGAYRAPAMTATFAFRRTARMRPAAWRVPGGHDGQQGEAPGRVARSAGQ